MAVVPKLVCVGVRTGNLVDQVIFRFDDGSQNVWGHTGGNIPTRWNIDAGDYIVHVKVREGNLLDAIQFRTARGKVSPFFGGRGGSKVQEFHADSGFEVVGLLMCRSRYSEYPVANGTVAGIHTRKIGGITPPMFWRIGDLKRLDVSSSPSNGYTYDGNDKVETNVVVYRLDLEQALKNPDLDPKVRAAILKVLDFPGTQFVAKIPLGMIVKKALGAGFTGEPLPIGLIQQLKTKGFVKGVGGYVQEYLQSNSQIIGAIAGVVLAHIVAPIYAANGEGQKAAEIAGGAMIALGAAVAIGGPAGIAIGLIAPFAIGGIFKVFGETASELEKRWKQDIYKLYETYSVPLGRELPKVKNLKCPNGHFLIDDGPPTMAYLAGGGYGVFRMNCYAGLDNRECYSRDSRWQFKMVRFYCPYCALCYCEPCILKHIREGKPLRPQVYWT